MKCYHCKNVIADNHIAIHDYCPHCRHDLHICKNCDWYDQAYNNECRESSAERVVDKERKNFCDYFKMSTKEGTSGPSKSDLLSAAEALFKKKN